MMIIKEIWVPIEKENFSEKIQRSLSSDDNYELKTEYKPFIVISLGIRSIYYDNNKVGETMSALAYDPETGKIDDIPLDLTYIKKIQDDKTKESVTFGAPGSKTK